MRRVQHRIRGSPTSSTAHGGLRFHDLRHCYSTWLVSHELRVNAVQHVMGHEQPLTTLNLYTHAPTDYYDMIRWALAPPADFRDQQQRRDRSKLRSEPR